MAAQTPVCGQRGLSRVRGQEVPMLAEPACGSPGWVKKNVGGTPSPFYESLHGESVLEQGLS